MSYVAIASAFLLGLVASRAFSVLKAGTKFLSGSGKIKLVLCVRVDLGMGKGKMCAQSGHAALGAGLMVYRNDPALFEQWSVNGEAKVVLKVNSREQIYSLKQEAEKAGLASYLVVDQGRTQIAPNSETVLAIGPGPADAIDRITGSLSLL